LKKVLIITYYWPPSGGSGVQRWLKFSKYLPEFGIEPIVLTVDPDFATYPSIDTTLELEVSDSIRVYRTKAKNPLEVYQKIRRKPALQSGFAGEKKSGLLDKIFRFIRGNVFLPDARIGWNPYAFEKAKHLIKEFNIETIITTSPPHSTQLIGLRLKKEFSLQWISDLRDPWTEIFYNKELFRTKWAEKQDAKMEKLCVEGADQVVVVSDAIKRSFLAKYPSAAEKFHVIPNGYDEKDFLNIDSTEKTDSKIISYVGNLGQQYPVDGFLDAFSKVLKQDPAWKLQFVGNCYSGVHRLVEQKQLSDSVQFIPYVSHAEAIKYMINASVLLLIIPDIDSNKGILTGKLFEYLATGNPILLIGPNDGDAATILNENALSITVNKKDIEKMCEFILNSTSMKPIKSLESIERFSRRNLTKEIVKLIKN
jgi:glycosyltransferase involved in cell wall biosynthesis